MKRYVGLDLSLTATGVVILDAAGEVVFHDTYGEAGHLKDAPRTKIERQIGIAANVVKAIKKHGIYEPPIGREIVRPEVGIELYAFSRRGKQNDLAELHGVVRSQLWMVLKIAPEPMTASHVRKVVLAKGNVSKLLIPKMIAEGRIATRTDWAGFEFPDGDQADAFVVAEALRYRDHNRQERLI